MSQVHLVLAEEPYETPVVISAFANEALAEEFAQKLRGYQLTQPEWPMTDEPDEVFAQKNKSMEDWRAAHPGGEDAAWCRFFSVLPVPFSAAPPAAEQPTRYKCPGCGAATEPPAELSAQVRCGACGKASAATAACAAAEQPHSTTSDKIRAELYDEAWEEARALGFGSVNEALSALARQQLDEQPDTLKVPRVLLDALRLAMHRKDNIPSYMSARFADEERAVFDAAAALLGKEGEA